MTDSLLLNEPYYDRRARERLRQTSLLCSDPVLIHNGTGIQEEELADELALLIDSGVVRLWGYAGEPTFPGTVGSFFESAPNTVISATEYAKIVDYVDARIVDVAPTLSELGYTNAAGVLLEQVVLRRRFFNEAKATVLNSAGLGEDANYLSMYESPGSNRAPSLHHLFSAMPLPRLGALPMDLFLDLRSKAHESGPHVMRELAGFEARAARLGDASIIVEKYRSELLGVIRRSKMPGNMLNQVENGGIATLEARVALLRSTNSLRVVDDWKVDESTDSRAFFLMLFDWNNSAR